MISNTKFTNIDEILLRFSISNQINSNTNKIIALKMTKQKFDTPVKISNYFAV